MTFLTCFQVLILQPFLGSPMAQSHKRNQFYNSRFFFFNLLHGVLDATMLEKVCNQTLLRLCVIPYQAPVGTSSTI